MASSDLGLERERAAKRRTRRKERRADHLRDPLASTGDSDPLFKENTPEGLLEATQGHSLMTVADVDGDGLEDLVFSRPANPAAKDEELRAAHHVVYRNTPEGLVDYTKDSGLENLPADQLLFGDMDNDGDQDVVGLQRRMDNRGEDGELLKHQVFARGEQDGKATYTPDTELLPSLSEAPFSRPAISGRLSDLDGDGKLDLMLGSNYASASLGLLKEAGVPVGPDADPKQQATLPGAAEFFGSAGGRQTLANSQHYDVLATDLGGAAGAEVLLGNYGVSGQDKGRNALLGAKGPLTDQAGTLAGSAGGNPVNPKSKGKEEAGEAPIGGNTMAYAVGDLDNDGDMDLVEANISHRSEIPASYYRERFNEKATDEEIEATNKPRRWADPSRILLNGGGSATSPSFEDASQAWGLPYAEGEVTTNIADLDNDGRQDVLMGQIPKYGHGEGGMKVNAQTSPGKLKLLNEEESGLGQTTGGMHSLIDLDGDGDLDMVTVGAEGAQVFNNEKGQDKNWIAVRLQGPFDGQTRDAVGARLTLVVGGQSLTREVEIGGHDGQTDTRWLYFGLGDAESIDKVLLEVAPGRAPAVELGHTLTVGKRNVLSEAGVELLD